MQSSIAYYFRWQPPIILTLTINNDFDIRKWLAINRYFLITNPYIATQVFIPLIKCILSMPGAKICCLTSSCV